MPSSALSQRTLGARGEGNFSLRQGQALTNLVWCVLLIPIAPALGIIADKMSLTAAFWAGAIILAAGALAILLPWIRAMKAEPLAEEAVVA